jgi:hypothetical protein
MTDKEFQELAARVRRIESTLFIQKLKDQPRHPAVGGLMEVLKKMPAMAPYNNDHEDDAA